MRDTEFVIIGQGLAGTALAWHLRWRGAQVLIVDREDAVTASRIAAGLMTPVTGQRLTKTWRLDEFMPAAVAFYRRVERETATRFLDERPMVRLLRDDAELRMFGSRCSAELRGLVRELQHPPDSSAFDTGHGGFEMHTAARVDVCSYLEASRAHFAEHDLYRCADIDLAADLERDAGHIRLPCLSVRARRAIFCLGYASPHPWFDQIRFDATRGEVLTLRIPGLTEKRVVHRGVWLSPAGVGLYRAGSTYDWQTLNSTTTPAARGQILSSLSAFLRLPVEVVDHQAAVRPVLIGRHPVMGLHSEFGQLGIFNGLGSKGCLQAPLLAEQFAASLTADLSEGLAIDAAVDVNRRFPPALDGNEDTVGDRAPDYRPRLTDHAHELVRNVVCAGDVAVDATAGNGHDASFLARQVGPSGTVFAFDVQSTAIERSAARLGRSGLSNVVLLQQDHARLLDAIPHGLHGQVRAVMFNLGYLPGGDKSRTTTPGTTLPALEAACRVLAPGGILTCIVYPGHEGGADEAAAVRSLLLGGDHHCGHVTEVPGNGQDAPRLFVVRKSES